jgi:hypothetical protein
MSHFKYIIALCYAFAFSGFASAVDINAGTIRNQSDAQTKCPGICSSKGYSWNGNWTTTQQTQERCPFAVVRALQTLMQALSGTMPIPRQNAPAFVKEKECNGMVSGRQRSKVKCPCAGAFSNQIRVPKIKVL